MHKFKNKSKENYMKNEINIINRQQELDRLSREPERLKESTIISSPGANTSAWLARIQENVSYNIYDVINVVLGEAGSEPVAMGLETQAINIAEPFDEQGTLPGDIYVIIFRLGNKYIFYAKP
jgi:hypothetical protein